MILAENIQFLENVREESPRTGTLEGKAVFPALEMTGLPSVSPTDTIQRSIQTLFQRGTLAGTPDGQLLTCFLTRDGTEADEAFRILVERHGPMVLGVCRGILGPREDVDDVFQATFLILIRKAASIRKREAVGPWLHGVAVRVLAGSG